MPLSHWLDLLSASGVVGAFLPVLVAVVSQAHWPAHAKGLVTAGLSTAAGLVTAWGVGDFRDASPLVAAVVVLLVASGSFQAFWRPTNLAPLIEAFTTWSRGKLPDRPIPTPPAPPSV